MSMLFLAGAIILICLAHLIRVLRWELFIDIYERPDRPRLIRGLSIGYLLNYVVPFKLGDACRAWYSGRKMKNGVSLGLSTVIVDRYLDVVCVGLIFAVLSVTDGREAIWQKTAFFYLAIAALALLLLLGVYLFKGFVKRVIKAIAGIFNEKIEAVILQFAWALTWNFKDIFQKIRKLKLIGSTILMWLGYLVSYSLFAAFLSSHGTEITWKDMFILLFTQNGIKESTGMITFFSDDVFSANSLFMVCYLLLPLLLLLCLSFFVKKRAADQVEEEGYLNLLPHLDPKERLRFLEVYFSDSNRDYIANYLKINQNISIIRDYSSGSNATTMLCMDGTSTFFRKYAFGEDGEKLNEQIQWIEENRERLALPNILRKEKTERYCYYDMPYVSNAVGLFEYAHSMPVEKSWKMIQNVLETLESSIYQINQRPADEETIRRYVRSKVLKNLEKITNAKRLKGLQQYDHLIINGVAYRNLKFYEKYLTEEYLLKVFRQDSYAVIHGDLTIENIICTRDELGQDDFYIIDPNTGNVHNSPNLDYAKLLQSIHGGYEFLMTTKEVKLSENHIDFLFTRSSAYLELHERLRQYFAEKFGEERTRSIYFHEMIHWLRLMPYKIEKDGKRALLFYAGMLMVMHDVFEGYVKKADDEKGKR